MSSLQDEQDWQDRIEQQEHEDCNQDYSSTGMCPCCGVELETYTEEYWTGTYDNVLCEEIHQTCPSCGWMSVPLYDG